MEEHHELVMHHAPEKLLAKQETSGCRLLNHKTRCAECMDYLPILPILFVKNGHLNSTGLDFSGQIMYNISPSLDFPEIFGVPFPFQKNYLLGFLVAMKFDQILGFLRNLGAFFGPRKSAIFSNSKNSSKITAVESIPNSFKWGGSFGPPLMTGILIIGMCEPLRNWVDEFIPYYRRKFK